MKSNTQYENKKSNFRYEEIIKLGLKTVYNQIQKKFDDEGLKKMKKRET